MRALAIVAALAAVAHADRVMVLPIDGDAPAATRKQLDAVLLDAAKHDGSTVTAGGATFAETAAAVGCAERDAACEELVLATLKVDGVAYGTASEGSVTLAFAEANHPRREQTIALDKLVAATDIQVFAPPPPPAAAVVVATPPQEPNHDTKLGVGLVGGGALVAIIGLALWASESSLQSQIDGHKTNSPDDIKDLLSIEDRASSYAWEGNIAVVLGVAAVGVGTYFLVRDRRVHATVASTTGGAAVVFGGAW